MGNFYSSNGKLRHYIKYYYFTHPDFDTPEYYEIHEIASRNLEDIILPKYCNKFEIFDAVDNLVMIDGKLINYAVPINLERFFVGEISYTFEHLQADTKYSIWGIDRTGSKFCAHEMDTIINPQCVVGERIVLNKTWQI